MTPHVDVICTHAATWDDEILPFPDECVVDQAGRLRRFSILHDWAMARQQSTKEKLAFLELQLHGCNNVSYLVLP